MNRLQYLTRYLLDLFYPNRCPCCNDFIQWNTFICKSCTDVMALPENLFCTKCGKKHTECICSDELPYDGAFVLSLYQEPTRSGILSLKTGINRNFGWYSGMMLAEQMKQKPECDLFDAVVPVPTTPAKRRQRGYNQAEIIGRAIADVTHIPVRTDILWKTKHGTQQHTLSAKKRMENVSQFQIHPINLAGYRLILCDDVLTTGSTICRCAQLLKQQGAETVLIAVAATTELKTNTESEV